MYTSFGNASACNRLDAVGTPHNSALHTCRRQSSTRDATPQAAHDAAPDAAPSHAQQDPAAEPTSSGDVKDEPAAPDEQHSTAAVKPEIGAAVKPEPDAKAAVEVEHDEEDEDEDEDEEEAEDELAEVLSH